MSEEESESESESDAELEESLEAEDESSKPDSGFASLRVTADTCAGGGGTVGVDDGCCT